MAIYFTTIHFTGKVYCPYIESYIEPGGSDCPRDCPMKNSEICILEG